MNEEPTITPVELRRVEIARPTFQAPKLVEPMPNVWRNDYLDLTAWEKTKMTAGLSWLAIKSIPLLYTIKQEGGVFSSKTTVAGIIKVIFMLLSVLGISTGHVTEATITAIVWGVVEIYQSYVTPDKPKA